MGLELENLRFCSTCSSINLVYHSSYTFETVKLDKENEEEVDIPVKICSDCDTIMFLEDGNLCRQFSPRKEVFHFVKQVNDNELHLINK